MLFRRGRHVPVLRSGVGAAIFVAGLLVWSASAQPSGLLAEGTRVFLLSQHATSTTFIVVDYSEVKVFFCCRSGTSLYKSFEYERSSATFDQRVNGAATLEASSIENRRTLFPWPPFKRLAGLYASQTPQQVIAQGYAIAIWLPMAIVTIYLFPLPLLLAVWKKPFVRGACEKCGYDLRASPLQCPECGAFRNYGAAPNRSVKSLIIPPTVIFLAATVMFMLPQSSQGAIKSASVLTIGVFGRSSLLAIVPSRELLQLVYLRNNSAWPASSVVFERTPPILSIISDYDPGWEIKGQLKTYADRLVAWPQFGFAFVDKKQVLDQRLGQHGSHGRSSLLQLPTFFPLTGILSAYILFRLLRRNKERREVNGSSDFS